MNYHIDGGGGGRKVLPSCQGDNKKGGVSEGGEEVGDGEDGVWLEFDGGPQEGVEERRGEDGAEGGGEEGDGQGLEVGGAVCG